MRESIGRPSSVLAYIARAPGAHAFWNRYRFHGLRVYASRVTPPISLNSFQSRFELWATSEAAKNVAGTGNRLLQFILDLSTIIGKKKILNKWMLEFCKLLRERI